MDLKALQITVKPFLYSSGDQVQIRIEVRDSRQAVATQQVYPVEYFESLFDVIWKNLGSALQQELKMVPETKNRRFQDENSRS